MPISICIGRVVDLMRPHGTASISPAAIDSRAFVNKSIIFCTSSTVFFRLPLLSRFACSASNASILAEETGVIQL